VCNHLENYYENIELLIETMEYKLLHIANGGLVSAQTVTEVLLEVLQNFDMKAYLKLVTALGDIYDNRDIKRLLKKKQS
jgi:transcriptional regulator NrdR family protein